MSNSIYADKPMIGYIYRTHNLINNKMYIGKRQKHYFDTSYLGSGTAFLKSLSKYGIKNFLVEILYKEYESAEKLWKKEQEFIHYYDAVQSKNYYNLKANGKYCELAPEARSKISEHMKGNQHALGSKHSVEARLRMSERREGYTHSFETRRRMSISQLGNQNNKGNKHSPETRLKISKGQQGKFRCKNVTIESIKPLRDKGLSYAKIAKHFGCTSQTIINRIKIADSN